VFSGQKRRMKAVLIKEPGEASQLYLGKQPKPVPKEDELLVRVHATSVNRADILQRQGKYPPPPGASPILGLDAAGVVEEVGSQCKSRKVGDQVMALLPGGGYAEYVVIPDKMAMPIPKKFTFEQAAAIPEVFLTAYQTLFLLGNLMGRHSVLIHAGASGVGTAAIQLAKEVGEEKIIVTAGSGEKILACEKLGATHGFNYKDGNFLDHVMEVTDNKGVDIILDFIGAPYWEQNLKCLATEGKLIIIAAMGGFKADKLNILPFLLKRVQVMGTTLRTRSKEYKIKLTEFFSDFSLKLFAEEKIKPIVDKVYPWEEVQDAHRYMEENKNIGKIVLKITS